MDKISDLNGDHEHLWVSYSSVEKTLDHSREEYDRLFSKKESLMLLGVEKGKKIEQIESEKGSIISSFKSLDEYGKVMALDFTEGFWYGETQVQSSILNILSTMKLFQFLRRFQRTYLVSSNIMPQVFILCVPCLL